MIPQCSEFASVSEPLSPPHPDEISASPVAWNKIANEQLKLLDDLQERWTDLRLRESALLHEQERWADWRAREEDDLERCRLEMERWMTQERHKLHQRVEEFRLEKERWTREMTAQEQMLIAALNELRQEGRLHEEGRQRGALAADFLASSSDERISLRRELSVLRKNLLLREAEVKRLRQQKSQRPRNKSVHGSRRGKGPASGNIRTRPRITAASPKSDAPSPPITETSSSSPNTPESTPTEGVTKSPKGRSEKQRHQLEADSAPAPTVESQSPTLKVRHVEKGNMLSIYWQGRGTPTSESGHARLSSRLLPQSRILQIDDKPVVSRRPSLSLQPRQNLTGASKPKGLTQVSTDRPLFQKNATVDLGDLFRRTPPPPLSSNSTEEGRPSLKIRRASDILAGMRSPERQRVSPPSDLPAKNHMQSSMTSSSSAEDEIEEARYKKIEEELNRRVHRLG